MTLSSFQPQPREQYYAALDMGSNSFHLVVVKVLAGSVQIVGKVKQKVRLAAGLDANNKLDRTSMERGWRCLETFAERLQSIPRNNIRIVATATLRLATNAQEFIDRGEAILGHNIEIISGEEEARQIFMGVAYTSANQGNSLVIDIGGASTEVIVGKDLTPMRLVSLNMGCVTYMQRYFPGGQLSQQHFDDAISEASRMLAPHKDKFVGFGWNRCLGASGTPQAITEIMVAQGVTDAIKLDYLEGIMAQCVEANTLETLQINGLEAPRKPIFPSGLAILIALFRELAIPHMQISGGALREGLIYGMLDNQHGNDVRQRTLVSVAERFHIDLGQAQRVRDIALGLFRQLAPQLDSNGVESEVVLEAAAMLHEIGMHIEFKRHHEHGAYILSHLAMDGYTQLQRRWVRDLVGAHRNEIEPGYLSRYQGDSLSLMQILIRVLRLSTVLAIKRRDEALPGMALEAGAKRWTLRFPEGWLRAHPLFEAELVNEAWRQHQAGWSLHCE